MKDTDREYLKELVRLDVSQTDCSAARKVLETCPDVADTLANPLVTYDEKRGIINKLFPNLYINSCSAPFTAELLNV